MFMAASGGHGMRRNAPDQRLPGRCGASTGKLRPAEFREGSGYVEVEEKLSEREVNPLWMSKEEVGDRVLDGVRNNELFIFTHREFREGVEERCRAMLSAFPDEPVNTERLRILTEWSPQTTIENGIRRTLGFEAEHGRWPSG